MESGKYVSYSPGVDNKLQGKLIQKVIDFLDDSSQTPQRPFSPIGSVEGYVKTFNTREVENYNKIISSFDEQVVSRKSPKQEEVNRLNFYCMKIGIEDDRGDIYVFRRVTKFRRLSKSGLIGRFTTGDFEELEEDLLGIDDNVDVVIFDGEMLILNHIALERIFSISDQYQEKAKETLDLVEQSGKIKNFEEFKEDCLSDKRITRILTKILMEEERIHQVFQNFDNVIQVINTFELPIELEKSNTVIVYEHKDQLMDITRLIRDSFYKSIIGEREGIDAPLVPVNIRDDVRIALESE